MKNEEEKEKQNYKKKEEKGTDGEVKTFRSIITKDNQTQKVNRNRGLTSIHYRKKVEEKGGEGDEKENAF